jgi:hypothetical protein
MLAGAVILANKFVNNRSAWDKEIRDGINTHFDFLSRLYSTKDKQKIYENVVKEELTRLEQLRKLGIII